MRILRLLSLGALLMVAATPASSACSWEWDCSGGPGTCRQVPICENAMELPPIRTPGIAPVVPPSVRPVQTPTLPPIGTRQCGQRYLCHGGQCNWQTVCE